MLAALILAAGAVRLADSMVDWADQVADAAPGLRSNVYAAEALGVDRTPPEAVIGPLSYVPVRAHDYLDAVADVGSPLHGSTPADIGGRPEQRAEADALLFDGLAPLRTSPLVAQADPSACSASAEAQPGSTWMIVVDGDRRPRAAVELGRFAEPRYRVEVPTGLNTLSLPEDAPVGTDAEVPYHLAGIEGALLCPIP